MISYALRGIKVVYPKVTLNRLGEPWQTLNRIFPNFSICIVLYFHLVNRYLSVLYIATLFLSLGYLHVSLISLQSVFSVLVVDNSLLICTY